MEKKKQLKTIERTDKTPSRCIKCLYWIPLDEFLKNDHRCRKCNKMPNYIEEKRCPKCRHYPHKEKCIEPVHRTDPTMLCDCEYTNEIR
jgi:hypothetical protein